MASAKGAIMSAGRRGRQHQAVALGPEGGQALRARTGPRSRSVPATARRPAAWTCSWRQPRATRAAARTSPMEKQVLAEAVVDGVEDLVAGERAPLGQHALLHEGTVEDLAGGPAQQGSVEVDEDGALRHGQGA